MSYLNPVIVPIYKLADGKLHHWFCIDYNTHGIQCEGANIVYNSGCKNCRSFIKPTESILEKMK